MQQEKIILLKRDCKRMERSIRMTTQVKMIEAVAIFCDIYEREIKQGKEQDEGIIAFMDLCRAFKEWKEQGLGSQELKASKSIDDSLNEKEEDLIEQVKENLGRVLYYVDCPACSAKRLHNKEEKEKYHPLSGKGFDRANSPKLEGYTLLSKEGEK